MTDPRDKRDQIDSHMLKSMAHAIHGRLAFSFSTQDMFELLLRQAAILDAPQKTAGEAVAWLVKSPNLAMQWLHERRPNEAQIAARGMTVQPLYTHPTPAAAPTDNTALVAPAVIYEVLREWQSRGDLSCDLMPKLSRELAALASRPAEATSREGVTEAARLRALLARAESFISGFEGDISQNGVDDLLREIRAGMVS